MFHKSEIRVAPDKWDAQKECIKVRAVFDGEKRVAFDSSVNSRKNLILRLYGAEANKDILTSDWLDNAVKKSLNPSQCIVNKDYSTLLNFGDKFLDEFSERRARKTGRTLQESTLIQYISAMKTIRAFAGEMGKSDFSFSEIDIKFFDSYVGYLQKLKLSQNYIGKQIKVLKSLMNEATKQGYNATNDFKDFIVFSEDVDNIYLSVDELELIRQLDLSENRQLDIVRDLFLILAWTGSRFSDIENIKRENIDGDCISFRQQKTGNKVVIPIYPVTAEILNKYNGILPKPFSNHKFNELIKNVGEMAGINSHVSFSRTVGGKLSTKTVTKYSLIQSHTGRRSFCTNMFKMGASSLMIMSISGHKTERDFMRYIKVKPSENAAMLKEIWSSFLNK
jgi:integrase